MKPMKLSQKEKRIEDALIRGEYLDVNASEFETIAQAIANRKKDAVLNLRVNSEDLKWIKQKAKKLGIKYQTFIGEFLHRLAQVDASRSGLRH
jgi:predicted DNA binding CopG/RHH family protein